MVNEVPSGGRVVRRCLELAADSDMPDMLFRAWLTPAYRAALDRLDGWMAAAGMTVRRDAALNLIGRYEGIVPDAPALVIGSHIDTVRDAGAFDGPLGVMLGIECVAALHAEGRRMPFAIEVIAFGDEEGSRFPAAMLTSRAVAGMLDPADLAIVDGDGITLDAALHAFDSAAGRLAGAVRAPDTILAYLEAHIEQGPVLESRGLALGTVTGIATQLRLRAQVQGRAGHAGTVTMALRRDALAAAAEMVLAVEGVARTGPGDLVATVGMMEVAPGAANVIPGDVAFTIDIRAGALASRDAADASIRAALAAIAAARGVALSLDVVHDLPPTSCDPALTAMMDASVADAGQPPFPLVSGAGHDAMHMATLCPIAMLFVRCAGGISHHPDESVAPADADAALAAMRGFIRRLGEHHDRT